MCFEMRANLVVIKNRSCPDKLSSYEIEYRLGKIQLNGLAKDLR